MKHHLMIHADNRPAAVERLLRVVRHRGFALQNMALDLLDEHRLCIQLTLTSDKPVRLLQNQLSKLVEVATVELAEPITRPRLTATA